MLALFISADGKLAVGEGTVDVAPEIACSPNDLNSEYKLLATDAVILNGEPVCVAMYEQVELSEWAKAIRKELDETECGISSTPKGGDT